jgi:hypothetical protein
LSGGAPEATKLLPLMQRVAKAQAVLNAALDAVVVIDRLITEAQARENVAR